MPRTDAERAHRARLARERTLAKRDILISSDKDATVAEVVNPAAVVVVDAEEPQGNGYIDIPAVPAATKPPMGRMVSVWDPVRLVNVMRWEESNGY